MFGDPDELRRRMEQFAEQMQGAQKVAWADNAIKLAVEHDGCGPRPHEPPGQRRAAVARPASGDAPCMFPEAVILVREAREGFGT